MLHYIPEPIKTVALCSSAEGLKQGSASVVITDLPACPLRNTVHSDC